MTIAPILICLFLSGTFMALCSSYGFRMCMSILRGAIWGRGSLRQLRVRRHAFRVRYGAYACRSAEPNGLIQLITILLKVQALLSNPEPLPEH